jgi:hypothetical protein
MLGEIALLDKGVRPDGGQQLVLGDHLMRVRRQIQEQIKGLGIERNEAVIAPERAGVGVKLVSGKLNQSLHCQHFGNIYKN